MQKFLLTVLLAAVAWVATAQKTDPASSGSRTRTTTTSTATPRSGTAISPRTNPTAPAATSRSSNAMAPRTSTPAPQLTPKSGMSRPEVMTERGAAAPQLRTTTSTPNSVPGSLIPHAEVEARGTATTGGSRPERNSTTSHYNGSGTARTVPAPVKNTASLKPAEPVKINWLTLEEAVEKNKTEKRKIFVDVFTDWCGWCKRMDETTFTDPEVVMYMNEHFYAVKFNAEQTNEIVFNSKTYRFKTSGGRGYHELAAEWLNNRLSFPTSVFLDENLSIIQPLPGYQDGQKLEAILHYFGTDSHRTTPWETYEKNYSSQQ